MIHAFTSAAVNYLVKVRLLCSSIKQYHPEFTVHLALADEVPGWLDLGREPFDNVISIDDLNIENKKGWIFGHSIVELSTAIKPFVLRRLLDLENCEGVLYFDPDIVLFSRLDDLIEDLRKANILLTPHQTKPEHTLEAIVDNEICSLKHGIYNLGFIGVRNRREGRSFAKWWSERLYHFCRCSIADGLFTDQRWIDFAPVFFEDVRIIKSSRFNVATWNVTTREVSGSLGDGFTVDGEPLGFYHFTGFDSGAHMIMANKYGGHNPAIISLVRWYEKQASIHRDKKIENTPWAYSTFSNGKPIESAHRLIYRMRRDLQDAYPDPFLVKEGAKSYYDWCQQYTTIEHREMPSSSVGSDPVSPFQIIYVRAGRIDWKRIRMHLKLAIRSRRQAATYTRSGWQILRSEGFRGLKSRLSSHT